MKYFAIHDYDKSKTGCFCIDDLQGDRQDLALQYNQQGYGIFWCLNINDNAYDDKGRTLRKADTVNDNHIISWFVDIDTDNKQASFNNILQSPVMPSKIIESRGGFHVYFKVKKGFATVANFKKIQLRLIDFFNGDRKCTDVVRLLRVPCFLNNKDKDTPFRVTVIHDFKPAEYDEKTMLKYFPESPQEIKATKATKEVSTFKAVNKLDGFFETLESLDQMCLLESLSGSSMVNGENYTFDRKGTHFNIIVNGKDSGCFINDKGHIIADKGYSHNVFNWLKWYGHNSRDIYFFLKDKIIVD